MKILEDLCSRTSVVDEINIEAERVHNIILSYPNVREIYVSTADKYIDVKTNPLSLKNPYGEGSLNLGCLVIRLTNTGYYEVYRDTDVPNDVSNRDTSLGTRIHPHVTDGHVCIGNAKSIVDNLYKNKDIPMFITFMLEFLQTYDKNSPYWLPWFKHPCAECGKLGSKDCRWCVCAQCSDKKSDGDRCGGCQRWKTQSAGAACAYIKQYLNARSTNMDEDDFIEAVRKTEELFT